jgi:predicted nucleic acid-binding protein
VIVVDASVLVPALGDDGTDGDQARARLRGDRSASPELIDLEVSSVLRRLVLGGCRLDVPSWPCPTSSTCHCAVSRIGCCSHGAGACGRTFTIYDASYVALAELLDAVLVTADLRLSQAPGLRCEVEVMTRSP